MPPAPGEQPDLGRADILRPLDESVPVEPRVEGPAQEPAGVAEAGPSDQPDPGAGGQPRLRPAVPTEPERTEPGPDQPERTEPSDASSDEPDRSEPVEPSDASSDEPDRSEPVEPTDASSDEPDRSEPGVAEPEAAEAADEAETQESGTAVMPEGAPELVAPTSETPPDVPEPDLDEAPARHRRSAALVGMARRLAAPPARLARRVGVWSRRPGGRYALSAALLATLVAGAVSMGAFVVPTAGLPDPVEPTAPGTAAVSTPPPGPPVVAPPVGSPGAPGSTPGGSSPPVVQGEPSQALAGWASQMSALTAIPEVALRAYGYAELAVAATTPACQLSWTTLAAIGRVESNHGGSGGATLLPDGQVLPPVLGAPLDGQGGRAQINDTDQGALDGDPVYDRAVGPMQFIPATWQIEQVDATGDGIADVNNIHDAALAAANYLCRGARNLATAAHWWQAVLSYNDVQVYANDVFRYANEYGLQSRG